ncbi:MAG: hypothetical protein OHK0022_52820 [Roseiflexaceae bacterium]
MSVTITVLTFVSEAVIALVVGDLAQREGIAKWRDKLRGQSLEALAFQRALAASYSAFAKKYPSVADAFFDEDFLKKQEVISQIAKIITPNNEPNIDIIERAWKDQFRYEPSIGINDPIRFFVDTLTTEAKSQTSLRPFFDSRALEQLYSILGGIENQSSMQEEMLNLLKEIRDLIKQGDMALNKTVRPPLEERLPPQEAIVTNFIGRTKEIKHLWNWFNNPNNRLWVLVGEGGKGKSALAYRFAVDVKNRAPEPLHAIIWMTAKRKRFLEGRVVVANPDFSDLDSALSQILISYGWLDEINQSIPDKEKMVLDLLQEFPALIVVDDVDSLDTENEDVISFFVLRVPYTKSKVLFTSRRVIFGMGANRTHVSGFGVTETQAFVSSRTKMMGLDKAAFDKSLIERIQIATEGSPLYIEDLLRLSAISRSISSAINIWEERGGHDARKYALGREIEMLSKDARLVLYAACIGHFAMSFAEIETLTGLSENKVSSALQDLQDIFLVPKPKTIEGEQKYDVNINTKNLVREVFGSDDRFKMIESSYRIISSSLPVETKSEVSSIIRQSALLIGQSKYEQAERVLLNAVTRYPSEPSIRSNLGRVYSLLVPTRLVDARESFLRAQQLRYNKSDMYEWWSVMESDQGEWKKSADVAEAGLAIDKSNKHLLYLAGNARLMMARGSERQLNNYQALQEARRAKSYLEQAVRSRSRDPKEKALEPKIYKALVNTCEILSDNSSARNYLNDWFRKYPDDHNVKAERLRLSKKLNLNI